MSAANHPRRRDKEQQLDDKEELNSQNAAASTTIQKAIQDYEKRQEQIVDKIRDPGISGDEGQAIKEELDAEMAGIYALANEDESDYRRHRYLNLNKQERYIASRNPGRLCDEPLLQLAQGTHMDEQQTADRPLTSRQKKKLREAMTAKTALHSLGRGKEGLKAVSEITAVTEHKRQTEAEDGGSSGGFISRIFR